MNSQEILNILNGRTHSNFLGVFPKDLIPSERILQTYKYPLSCVVNTDPSTSAGEHWVAYYYTSPRIIEFFDSYGKHPSTYDLDIYKSLTSFNTYQLQSFYSTVCGHYCVYYLLARSPSCSLANIISHFHLDTKANDKYVGSFIKNRFAHCNRCISTSTCFCLQSCKPHHCDE